MVKKVAYSFLIGLKKATHNVLVTAVLPAFAYTLLNATEWMPPKYNAVAGIVVAFGAYLTKNYIRNK